MSVKNKQCLTFALHGWQCGIEAEFVQEIFPLPELTPIAEVSNEIMGIINLRGQIVPIIHLALLQEKSITTCNLNDYLIVLQWSGLQIGMVVHQVNELLEMPNELIETNLTIEVINTLNTNLITGFYKEDKSKILLLDIQKIIPKLDSLLSFVWDAQMQIDTIATSATSDVGKQRLEINSPQIELPNKEESCSPLLVDEGTIQESCSSLLLRNSLGERTSSSFYDLYCPNSRLQEREIFRQRADNLRQPIDRLKFTDKLLKLAVMCFGNEYFAVELELVRTFANISNLTPIPCCPKHIIGNMNLRGEIVTLVDIREVLHLPISPINLGSQMVVVQVDDIVAGLPIDQVWEMVNINSDDIKPLPQVLSNLGEEYLSGIAFYQEKMLRILDLPKIFTHGGLIVNEEV